MSHRNFPAGHLWRVSVSGGVAKRLTYFSSAIFGVGWTPDAAGVVLSREIERCKVLSRLNLPSKTVSDFGIQDGDVLSPAVSASGDALAFEVVTTRSRINLLKLSFSQDAQPLYETTTSNSFLSQTADGNKLVLQSDRSGRNLLWWLDLAHANSLHAIEDFNRREVRHIGTIREGVFLQ